MYVLEPQSTCFMLSFLDFFVIACNLWRLLLKHNCNKTFSIFHNRIRMIARDYLNRKWFVIIWTDPLIYVKRQYIAITKYEAFMIH